MGLVWPKERLPRFDGEPLDEWNQRCWKDEMRNALLKNDFGTAIIALAHLTGKI